MVKQVEKSHYRFEKYMAQPRWGSLWYPIFDTSRLIYARLGDAELNKITAFRV